MRRIRGLYAITPEHQRGTALLAAVRAALAGGASVVQYRAKQVTPGTAREEASLIRAACTEFGATLVINDDPALAVDVCADAVHVGRDDGSLRDTRRAVGNTMMIGVSCYDRMDLAVDAVQAGADYVAFGSFFPSTVKPGAVRPSISLLTEARRRLPVPIVAIGGITVDNAHQLIDAGADAVAVITGLFEAEDVRARAVAFLESFDRPGNHP